MKSDSLFYTFFQTLPEALFMLSGEDATNAAAYRFQSIEVKDHAFRLDGVLALPDFSGVYFFVEVQYQRDKRFYSRLFAELMIFLHQHRPKGHWRAVVVYPKRSIDTGLPNDYEEYLASGRLKIVYLNELSPEALQTYPLTLLQIINAPARKADIVSALRATLPSLQASAQATGHYDDMQRLLAKIVTAKLPKLSFEEIEAMIEPTTRGFEQSRFYRDIIQRGEKQGIEKGIEKGIVLGEQNKNEAIRLIARNLLTMGLPVKRVVEATGLPQKTVSAIRKEITLTSA
jgi:predicted transposase/invertase (TIGR01784 family)